MYKILIVDDEKWIRKGIIAKLRHLGFEFSWIGESENGAEAVELIREQTPQIVITDVRMPVMDGIQMIKNLREAGWDIKTIIISGYADFHYAEQALNLGVWGYILKPIAEGNLRETLEKVMARLDEEKELQTIKEHTKALERNQEFLMQERAVNCIFHTPERIVEDSAPINLYREVMGEKAYYRLILIHVDNSNYTEASFKYRDLDFMKSAIRNIVEESGAAYHVFVMDNLKDPTQLMIFLSHLDQKELNTNCQSFVNDVYAKIEQSLGIAVTIAVSAGEEGITSELYRQAKAALDMRMIERCSRIHYYENIKTQEKLSLPEHKLKLSQNLIELHELQNVYTVLNDIFLPENLAGMSQNYIRLLYHEIIGIVLRNSGNMDKDLTDAFHTELVLGEMLDYFDDPAQIVMYLYTTIVDMYKEPPGVGAYCREMVSKAREFIINNYFQEITVKDLACRFAINPNYFSTIFRQETGVTLTKFIMDVRMEKACGLLQETQASISEIARIVGYPDVQYFYRVFKKATGHTPLEFRNSGN